MSLWYWGNKTGHSAPEERTYLTASEQDKGQGPSPLAGSYLAGLCWSIRLGRERKRWRQKGLSGGETQVCAAWL